MTLFLERFLLPVCAAVVVALALVNPLKFDLPQRLSLGTAICLIAYFVGHTIKRGTALPPPPDANLAVLQSSVSEGQRKIEALEKQMLDQKNRAEHEARDKDLEIQRLKSETARQASLLVEKEDRHNLEQTRAKLQEALSELVVEGNRLRQQWGQRLGSPDNDPQRQSAAMVAQWHSKVRGFLSSVPRSRAYQARFDIPVPQLGVPEGMLVEVSGWWGQLSSDLARLNEFIADADLGKP